MSGASGSDVANREDPVTGVTGVGVEQSMSVNSVEAFRYPLDVRFFEVDSLGVVFNMWYLGWCDEAMSAFMESIGYGYAALRAQGMDAVLRKAEIEWLDSLQAFQHAEVVVRVDRVGTTSFRLDYVINRVDAGRTRCARAQVTYVCVQISDRTTSPIPHGLREVLVAGQA